MSGVVLNLIRYILSGRKVKVVLDGNRLRITVNSGILQDSFFGHTLFLVFINDLPDSILSKLALYADDTTLYLSLWKTSDIFDKVEMAADLEDDLLTLVDWFQSFSQAITLIPFLLSVQMNGSEHICLSGLTFTNIFCPMP